MARVMLPSPVKSRQILAMVSASPFSHTTDPPWLQKHVKGVLPQPFIPQRSFPSICSDGCGEAASVALCSAVPEEVQHWDRLHWALVHSQHCSGGEEIRMYFLFLLSSNTFAESDMKHICTSMNNHEANLYITTSQAKR